jgi:hypothetical protein
VKLRKLAAFAALGIFAVISGAACGSNTPVKDAGAGYQEYECPAPIGKIVREDCESSKLKYEGESFSGSVGAVGVGASAEYKESAIREADSLVQMLKEQRNQLCNNFNTCKVTVKEYREDQKRLDDSFVALVALKDKMANVDAEGATKLLDQIRSIRSGAEAGKSAPADPGGAAASPGGKQGAGAPAATPGATPAAPAFTCKGPSLLMFQRGMIAGPAYGYDKTREALKGHPELGSVEFYEFILEQESMTGAKKQEYALVGVAPDMATLDKLRTVVKGINPGMGHDIPCPSRAPARKLDFAVK